MQMFEFIGSRLLATAAGAVALAYVVRFLIKGYKIRSKIHDLVWQYCPIDRDKSDRWECSLACQAIRCYGAT